MARFNFKLQRVLEYRKHKEDQIKTELFQIKQLYSDEETALLEIEEKIDECLMRFYHKQAFKIIAIEEIIWYNNYLLGLHQLVNLKKKRMEELLVKIEETRQRLIKASQEKKVLEKLKERRLIEFNQEIDRAEQIFLDEIAMNKKRGD